jgi:hypothetical protein
MLVLELPLAIILGAAVMHRRLLRRDWLAAGGMAAGLGTFIAALHPTGGHARQVSTGVALVALGVSAAAVVSVVLAAQLGPRPARAALLGTAAGSGFGLSAAMMKLTVARLSDGGVVSMLTSWQTYAMVIAGLSALGLVQAALNAGTLVAVQPGLTILDPLVSVVWGVLVVGEHVRSGPILALAGAGACLVAVAAYWLAHAAARSEAASRSRTHPAS